MRKERKHYNAEEKVAILRRHLLDKVPVSDLCEELGLRPTVFYRWQKEFFENGAAAFQAKGRSDHQTEQSERERGEDDPAQGRSPGRVALRKRPSGTLNGVWVPHDARDQIVDFVRRW